MDNNLANQLQEIQEIYLPVEIVVNLLSSFLSGLIISLVYKKTHKGLSYSQSFMITNIFLCVIVCMVIMIIGNSLARAFALVGALSIIRFRTVIKDTKDIAYIFWSLAAGLGCGTGSYFLTLSGNILLIIIAFILFKTNFGSIYKSEFILQFRYLKNSKNEDDPQYNRLFKKFTKSNILLNAEPSGDKDSLKLTFDVLLIEEKNIDEFINELSELSGVSEVSLTASKNDIDY